MKNSKEYSKKIQRLYRSLSRKYPKVQKFTHDEPLDAIVYAIISAELSENATESAIKRFADYFVDLNDLRVSQTEEIVGIWGEDTPVTRNIASTITRVLRGVFNEYHKMSLEALKKTGKRPARQILEKIDGTSRFVVDYCMLTSLQGHAIPLTKEMIEYLKKKGYEFYSLLRRESEARKSRKKKTTKSKKKTKKKQVTRTKKRKSKK